MIDKLGKENSLEAKKIYDILSESCHPNFAFQFDQIAFMSKYNYKTVDLNPEFEKILIFQFETLKKSLLGIKKSLNNVTDLCFQEYQIKWIKKPPVQVEIDQDNTEKQRGSLSQKILKWFS